MRHTNRFRRGRRSNLRGAGTDARNKLTPEFDRIGVRIEAAAADGQIAGLIGGVGVMRKEAHVRQIITKNDGRRPEWSGDSDTGQSEQDAAKLRVRKPISCQQEAR